MSYGGDGWSGDGSTGGGGIYYGGDTTGAGGDGGGDWGGGGTGYGTTWTDNGWGGVFYYNTDAVADAEDVDYYTSQLGFSYDLTDQTSGLEADVAADAPYGLTLAAFEQTPGQTALHAQSFTAWLRGMAGLYNEAAENANASEGDGFTSGMDSGIAWGMNSLADLLDILQNNITTAMQNAQSI